MGDMGPPPPGRASHSAPNVKTMGLAGFYCETFKIGTPEILMEYYCFSPKKPIRREKIKLNRK